MNDTLHLSTKEANVLAQLSVRNKYGLKLVDDSGDLLTRSAVYVILGRMTKKQLIKATVYRVAPRGKSGPPRRMYRITARGRRALAAYKAWTT